MSLLLRSIGALVALFAVYCLVAFGFFALSAVASDDRGETGEIPVYLYVDDFHADLLIPVEPMSADWDYLLGTPHLPLAREDIKMISLGWGSREFYLQMRHWDRLTPVQAIKALAFDRTVMHVTFYPFDRVDTDNPMVIGMRIGRAGMERMRAFIKQGFRLDREGNAVAVPGKSYGFDDLFFEANGRYQPLRTCNQWTAEALRTADVEVPLWTPFAQGLKWSLVP